MQNEPNSQLCRVGRGPSGVGRGVNVQNEPNLGRAPKNGRGRSPEALTSKRCKTNPISGEAGGARDARESCKTNPICPAGPGATRPQGRGTRGDCAKRSQFRGVRLGPEGETRETNPISVVAGQNVRSPWCKTKPIYSGRARKTIAKARGLDAATRAGGKCARRSQSRRGRVGRGLGDEGRLCKTNPILARPLAATPPPFQHSHPMPIVQNKANLRRRTVRLVIVAAPGYHGDVPRGMAQLELKKV